MDILTWERLLSIANMELIYWYDRSSSRSEGGGVKGVDGCYRYFSPLLVSLEYENLHVIIHPLLRLK